MNWFQRLFHHPQIPQLLWEERLRRLPFLHYLNPDDKTRLKTLSESLLASKSMSGAGEFALTDEVAVDIAVQACLPVLNLSLDLYEDMPGIVVYPDAFIVPYHEVDEIGVVHEGRETLAGEAITAGGVVVLSWADVTTPAGPEHNVVIHEFAHVIDLSDGGANGRPPFLQHFHASLDTAEWQTVFSKAYADLCQRVDRLEGRLPPGFEPHGPAHAALAHAVHVDLPLDPYACTNPAEFFAVASEAFFVRPNLLTKAYPDVYKLLSAYYRQNPLGRP
jgi:Mlc titration factor MtfA (ptsG expression regulator)